MITNTILFVLISQDKVTKIKNKLVTESNLIRSNKVLRKLYTLKEKLCATKIYIYYVKFLKVYLPFSSIVKLIWDIIMVSNYSKGGYLFLI